MPPSSAPAPAAANSTTATQRAQRARRYRNGGRSGGRRWSQIDENPGAQPGACSPLRRCPVWAAIHCAWSVLRRVRPRPTRVRTLHGRRPTGDRGILVSRSRRDAEPSDAGPDEWPTRSDLLVLSFRDRSDRAQSRGETVSRIPLLPTWAAALVLATGCITSQKPDGYEEAIREARLNASAIENHGYHAKVGRLLRNPIERAGRRCSVTIPDTRGARLLYRLDAAGVPTEVLIYPDADLGHCVYEAIRDVPLPPPPEPDYWIAIGVHSWVRRTPVLR